MNRWWRQRGGAKAQALAVAGAAALFCLLVLALLVAVNPDIVARAQR
jgi:hypothetical protein